MLALDGFRLGCSGQLEGEVVEEGDLSALCYLSLRRMRDFGSCRVLKVR